MLWDQHRSLGFLHQVFENLKVQAKMCHDLHHPSFVYFTQTQDYALMHVTSQQKIIH